MGYIKEPKAVDFIVESKPLTDRERKEISKHIAEYKERNSKKRVVKTKSKQPV